MPVAEASTAAMRAASSTSEGFQVAACPSGIGKNSVEAVDNVAREHQRNAEARLLHGLTLQCVHHLGIYLVDNRADTALRHSRSERVEVGGIELIELPHFFTQSHLREQRVDARLYCGRRNRSNSGSAAP